MRSSQKRRAGTITASSFLAIAAASGAQAATLVWNSSGGSWNTTSTNQAWLNAGSPSAFTNGDTVIFDGTVAGQVNFNTTNSTVAPASTSFSGSNFIQLSTPGAWPQSGISGTGSLTVNMSTSNTQVLIQSYNTYTGATSILGGQLMAQGNTGSPVSGIADGGVASAIGASSSLASNLVISGGSLRIDQAGSNPNRSTNRLFTIGAVATIHAESGVNFTNTGAIEFLTPNQASTLNLNGHTGSDSTRVLTFNPQLTDNGSGVLNVNAGAKYLSMAGTNNTFTGAFVDSALNGTLTIVNFADGGQASSIGASSNAAANFKVFGGQQATPFTIKFAGNGNVSGRNITVTDANRSLTLDSSGNGAIEMTGNVVYQNTGSSNAATLGFAGSTAANVINKFGGTIVNSNVINGSPMTMSVNKTGSNTWKISGNNTYNGDTTVGGGTLLVDGGLVSTTKTTTNSTTASGSSTIVFASGTISTGLQYGAYVSGTGIAAGTRITNVNTNTNTVTLSQATTGTIAASSLISFVTGSGTGTGNVAVAASATLGGSGLVYGATTIANNAVLAPGTTTGVLAFGTTLTLAGTDSKSNLTVANGARGTAYDGVDVAGALAYNGDLTLTIDSALDNGTYHLFTFGSQSGNFDTITLAGAGPYSGSLTYDGVTGLWSSAPFGDTTLQFSTATGNLVVPEPAGLSLVFASSLALLGRRRRKHQTV